MAVRVSGLEMVNRWPSLLYKSSMKPRAQIRPLSSGAWYQPPLLFIFVERHLVVVKPAGCMPGYLSVFPLQNPKCPDNVSFTARTGSPKEVLEVAFRHQFNGVDHPVCRVPTMTEGRPWAISPPPAPRTPRPSLFLRSWRAGT